MTHGHWYLVGQEVQCLVVRGSQCPVEERFVRLVVGKVLMLDHSMHIVTVLAGYQSLMAGIFVGGSQTLVVCLRMESQYLIPISVGTLAIETETNNCDAA